MTDLILCGFVVTWCFVGAIYIRLVCIHADIEEIKKRGNP